MNNNFSLDKLRDNPDFAALFAKKAVDIKKNKDNLLEAAQAYQSKYKEQVAEGTIKRQIMLTEGKANGLKEDDIFKDNQVFIPTAKTPILNYLYFLLCEHGDMCAKINVLRAAEHVGIRHDLLQEELDKTHGKEVHTDHKTPEEMQNVVSYIYGQIGDDTMSTLKKLKTLSMSENEAEAFAAFRKGHTIAKKYGLEWDKIPINR